MPAPLLQTKLYIPPMRPDLVSRPRLIERLNAGPDRRLTLISAPAGFGKTTLLSSWLHQLGDQRTMRPVRSAWLSLDAGDNDPRRFLTYLVAALQTAQPNLGQAALAALQSPQQPPAESVLTGLINEIAALPDPIVLVLDDYHVISAPPIHQGVTFLLEHGPPNLHLVISTRADPALPVFRLRARGQLTELRSNDLRFTPDEATTFLNTVMGLDLTPGDVGALEARTEGWIVGLQLAALSLQGRSDAPAFIAAFSGSHHYVLEYLTHEVVRRQTEPLQRFLMETSILERLCGPLCDALTGGSDGAAVLADLHRRNLFIVPLDDERRWYRYHHLFADLLGNLLRQERPADHIRELHSRASAWHECDGDLEHAIQHALRARDLDRAASLIEHAAQTLIAQGRLTTFLRWIEPLPEALLRARPRLRLYQGWALSLSGQTDRGEEILQDTRATLQSLPPAPQNEALLGQLAALLTSIATLREEADTVIQEAREALTCLPQEDRLSRGRVYVALGTAYAYRDDTEEAIQTWRRGRDLALEANNPFLATAAIEMLAGYQIYHQGRLRTAARALQRVLDLGATPDGTYLPFTSTAHALLAEIQLEWNDLEVAARTMQTAIELLRRGGISHGRIHTFCARARLERALDNPDGVLAALQTAERDLESCPMRHIVLHLVAYQVRLRLWLGDLETAARWAEGHPSTVKRQIPEDLPLYLQEVQRISLARVHLAGADTQKALTTLEGLAAQARASGRLAQAIEASLLEALAWQARGDAPAALRSLERSLAWAEPEGYLRLFLEAGLDVIPLLRLAAARGISPDYVRQLLAALAVDESPSDTLPPPHAHTPTPPYPPAPTLIDPLTPREREVLELIRDGHTNRQIAEALFVTLNTVKKHTSNIYSKLGVKSRTQAVARTHDLGLLA